MNHALGSSAIQLLRCQLQLRLSRRQIAGSDCRPDFADLCLNGRFRGPILCAAFQALPQSSLRTLRMWHTGNLGCARRVGCAHHFLEKLSDLEPPNISINPQLV